MSLIQVLMELGSAIAINLHQLLLRVVCTIFFGADDAIFDFMFMLV